MNKLIVFSGGPFSGKTTTIEKFKNDGYTIIEEAALDVINSLKRKLGSEEQQKFIKEQPVEFQKMIFKKQIENERLALSQEHKGNLIFLDRSVLDGFAYLHYNKQHWHQEYFNFVPEHDYTDIFIFETLTSFDNRQNSGRIENTIDDSLAIKNSILFTYQFFGYKPFIVFEKSIEERLEDIKNKI